MKIGVCGTGRMGASIAQRLIAVGHEVGVWNRDPVKTKPLVDAGAKRYASPAELAQGCDTVIVMLLNDAATEAVYRGPNGILEIQTRRQAHHRHEHGAPGHHDIYRHRGDRSRGAAFVECPVGGSTVPAKEGKLFGLVGGTKPMLPSDAAARAIVPPHRTCRGARCRRDHEARGQPAAVGVLAGAGRIPDHLQAAQSSARAADRYPVRHRRAPGRHERDAAPSSPRYWAARRSAKPRSASPPRKRISPRPCNSPPRSMRNCRSRPARWPASRKRKPRALARPTPPPFPFAGPSARPPHPNRKSRRSRTIHATTEKLQ
jgi:hypothetical protein